MSCCTKRILNEAGVFSVVSNCEYISNLTKTVTLPEDVCTSKEVSVTLTITFFQDVQDVKIIDNIANNFIENVVSGSVSADIGLAKIVPGLKIEWDIPSVTAGTTATLTYTVIVKDSAIGKPAYVNNNVTVNAKDKPTCSFNKEDGLFEDDFVINCGCDAITEITKTISDNIIGCDEKIQVTLSVTLDKAFNELIITDKLATQYVGNIEKKSIDPNTGNVSVVEDEIVWTITNSEARKYELIYEVTPILTEPSGYVNEYVSVQGTGDTSIACTYTRDDEGVFNDSYEINCNVVDAKCCCISCQPFITNPCEGISNETIQVDNMECNGKLVNISVYFPKVCVGRKLVVGVSLIEIVGAVEIPRGFKVREIIVPNGDNEVCKELVLSNFCFVMEDPVPCVSRSFVAKAIAHYSDIAIPVCNCAK